MISSLKLTFLLMIFTQISLINSRILNDERRMRERNFVDPKFSAPILNITVPVSRDAILVCKVHDLYQYKVAWLRVDTQTILTIGSQIITKNHRISIFNTEKKIWELRIREVKETDKGWYMCQINTDPMKSQMGYLNVVVSPDILDDPTSHDIIVQESENVTLTCKATGSPEPAIFWKREGQTKTLSNRDAFSYIGPVLQLPMITIDQAGAYLCIASNGIPPSVSKRITVIVNFKPKLFVSRRDVHSSIGQEVVIEFLSESYPNSVNYWIRGHADHSSNRDSYLGGNIESLIDSDGIYRVTMRHHVRLQRLSDFGVYKCVAKNALGTSEEFIKVLPASKIVENNHWSRSSNGSITLKIDSSSNNNDSSSSASDNNTKSNDIVAVASSVNSDFMSVITTSALLLILFVIGF